MRTTMADDRTREEIITRFFLNTCDTRRRVTKKAFDAWQIRAFLPPLTEEFILLTTGSAAEFYIDPMLSCVGDIDIMLHCTNGLAIPEGFSPPSQLPGEFDSHVIVYEIVDSEFPGYVYLVSSHLLTECVDDRKYNAVQCERFMLREVQDDPLCDDWHGPAVMNKWPLPSIELAPSRSGLRYVESTRFTDTVYCWRCLTWPPQAADWPIRHRNSGWPDSSAVDLVVRNGCDVVQVAHPLSKQDDEWMSKFQWRLSFSRAEIALLNSWVPEQQIAYHLLRVFMKNTQLTDSANNPGAGTLSNYHIKTLMLWACELKPRRWWIDDFNIVSVCVELLHTLAGWLNDGHCEHYFISNCNLFDPRQNSRCTQETANRLLLITGARFCEWCINYYLQECAQLCPTNVSNLLSDGPTFGLHGKLQDAVSAIAERRGQMSRSMDVTYFVFAECRIMELVSRYSLTLRSCLCLMNQLAETDHALHLYFTAVVFLHVALKTTQGSLTDEMLDVLAATCLQVNDVRRCVNARHSSLLSLNQAAVLMKVVANNSRSTVQLIEIELSKAYLHRALRCEDSNRHSIYCLANVYLAVLYYTTGQYETATDYCTLVTRSQDHSQCSSHVIQGELLLKIDDQVDSILGLAVFYQYIRAATLNEEQHRRHVSVFTTELFAHYLLIKSLSVAKIAEQIQRYQSCMCNAREIFVTDAMAFCFASSAQHSPNERTVMADRSETNPLIPVQLDTSELVELLQQSAVDHLTTCREREARYVDSAGTVTATADYEALYAYKCGQYQRCLQLSLHDVRTLLTATGGPGLRMLDLYPELIQLMDDDIVALIGLTVLINPLQRSDRYRGLIHVSRRCLSLYLLAQCQIKLHHPVTSLAATLDYVQDARSKIRQYTGCVLLDEVVLKLVRQNILSYMLSQ